MSLSAVLVLDDGKNLVAACRPLLGAATVLMAAEPWSAGRGVTIARNINPGCNRHRHRYAPTELREQRVELLAKPLDPELVLGEA